MPEITFSHVSVRFDEQTVLDDISTRITEHRVGIIGANGSGKSTLTRLINGLSTPTEGTVSVDGRDIARYGKEIRQQVGFIFSDAENQIVMPLVRDDIAFSLRRFPLSAAEKQQRVDQALNRFGLADLAHRSPHQLSGGQKQLLALAAVVVLEPALIIADEPTTLLDLRNRDRIRREFAALEQQLICVSHDLDFLSDFDRILCIDNHQIVADGPPPEVIDFYRDLMASRPL